MIYVVFTLVYLIGGAWTFTRVVIDDTALRVRLEGKLGRERLPGPPRFWGYLFWFGLLWPLTLWYVLYGIWQEHTKRKA